MGTDRNEETGRLGYNESMSLEERSRQRRRRIVTNRTTSFTEAETWDLDFWQSLTPEERLSALVALRRDVELARADGKLPAGSED